MPRRSVRCVELRAEERVVVGGAVLLPIARVVLVSHCGVDGVWMMASKAPHAVIVRDAAGTRATAADGSAASLDALRAQLPELDAALAFLPGDRRESLPIR